MFKNLNFKRITGVLSIALLLTLIIGFLIVSGEIAKIFDAVSLLLSENGAHTEAPPSGDNDYDMIGEPGDDRLYEIVDAVSLDDAARIIENLAADEYSCFRFTAFARYTNADDARLRRLVIKRDGGRFNINSTDNKTGVTITKCDGKNVNISDPSSEISQTLQNGSYVDFAAQAGIIDLATVRDKFASGTDGTVIKCSLHQTAAAYLPPYYGVDGDALSGRMEMILFIEVYDAARINYDGDGNAVYPEPDELYKVILSSGILYYAKQRMAAGYGFEFEITEYVRDPEILPADFEIS